MNKEQFFTEQERQIETYKTLIKVLGDIKPIIKSFEGKVINVKLKRSIEELFANDRNIIVGSIKDGYYGEKQIEVWHIKYGYSNYYNEVVIKLTENSTEKRVNSDFIFKNIDTTIERFNKSIAETEKGMKEYNDMMAEYKAIAEQIRVFNKKYSYTARSNNECDFSRVY